MTDHPIRLKEAAAMTCYRPIDLAKRWSCSEPTVRAMIRRGELKAFKVGGKLLRISSEEVVRWESQGSSGIEENGPSKKEVALNAGDVRLVRLTENKPSDNSSNTSISPLSEWRDRRR